MKRRWALLGFNLVLAMAILAQPGQAASECDFKACTCACLEVWDECFEGGEKIGRCDKKYDRCMKKSKCKADPKLF